MDVILLEKVGKLGDIGDQVVVKAGFGRNFLLPQGKAIRATPENVAEFEKRRAELEAAAAAKKAEAEARAAKLAELSITISSNAGDEGKLLGSIGTRDIAEAITAAGVEVSNAEVKLPEGALREGGEYEIDIQVHAEVLQAVKLSVVAESSPLGVNHCICAHKHAKLGSHCFSDGDFSKAPRKAVWPDFLHLLHAV